MEIKLIAGEALNVGKLRGNLNYLFQEKGPIYTRTPAYYMDIKIEPKSIYE